MRTSVNQRSDSQFPQFEESFLSYLAEQEIALLESVRQFLVVHEQWVADGDERPDPDEDYWYAVDALCNSFSEGDIPHCIRPLYEKVQKFQEQRDIFDQREEIHRTHPKQGFFKAREAIEETYFSTLHDESEPKLPPLENIRSLIDNQDKNKIGYEQIARMYRFYDAQGRPDVSKVTQEYNNPGSVIGPDWVDPRLEEWRKERLKRKSATERKHSSSATSGIPKSKAKATKTDDSPPCKETPFDLWFQKVSIEQSARMLKISIDEVKAKFDEFDQAKANKEREALGISAVQTAANNNTSTSETSSQGTQTQQQSKPRTVPPRS
jgi:hypothetical protein